MSHESGLTISHSYNLLDPQVIANPYPVYQKLRAEVPVYWHEGMQRWLITRFNDVTALLREPRFSAVPPDDAPWESRRRIMEILSDQVLLNDAPNHTRLRGLMEKAVTPLLDRMKQRTQQVVDSLLDVVQESGRMEIIGDLTDPLLVTVHSEFLGVPASDSGQIRQSLDYYGRFAFGLAYPPTTPEEDQQILQNLLALTDYFHQLLEQRRQEPKEDLITALAHAEEQGDKLSQQEVLTNFMLVSIAGYGIAPIALGNSLLALSSYPDQMQKLQDDPTLIESAVDELLRYESFLQWVPRRATEDIEVHGQLIRKDQIALFGLGSANRDEARFPDPDRLDITRTDNQHIAFSYGSHSCLGASFARLYTKIAINTVLRRLRGLRLETDNLERIINSPIVRMMKSVPVTFERSYSLPQPVG